MFRCDFNFEIMSNVTYPNIYKNHYKNENTASIYTIRLMDQLLSRAGYIYPVFNMNFNIL